MGTASATAIAQFKEMIIQEWTDPVTVASWRTAHARFFNPAVGIAEDPATGSAAGPLGSYLTARGLVAEGVAIVVEQGHLAGRPSRIEVRVRGDQVQVLQNVCQSRGSGSNQQDGYYVTKYAFKTAF